MRQEISAAVALDDFATFFREKFPGFEQMRIGGEVYYIRRFDEKKLEISVKTPVVLRKGENLSFKSGRSIEFSVSHDDEGQTLKLRDSRLTEEWRDVVTDKTQVLIDLIEDISMCGRCDTFFYPHWNKEIQVNPKGTPHVILTCPECCRNDTTTFRKENRLKTRLHKYLPKKER